MAIFTVREGKLVGRETYSLNSESVEEDKAAVVSAFLKQHYSELPQIPKEIIVSHLPEDTELLQKFLAEHAGHAVHILRPERGEKRALLQMASKDVIEMIKTVDERAAAAAEREETLAGEIFHVLETMGESGSTVPAGKYRVEAYDISNTNGIDTVGAMVVFDGLKPDKQSYRKFRIRSIQGQDDYGAMTEVLSRRFTRVFKGDEGFSVLPDVILMDGGKGHVSTALEVVEATGFDIPVIGMVKDDKHRTRALIYKAKGSGACSGETPGSFVEISLKDKPMLYKYVGRIQEEVHRFAITYHHNLRNKSVQKSILDDVPGIGPKRRQALLEAFGSVEKIRDLAKAGDSTYAVEAFAQVSGMDRKSAKNLIDFFKGKC